MRSWFERPLASEPATRVDELGAYKDGRADERGRLRQEGPHLDRAVGEAYDRGRREERLRHRGSPLLAFLTLVLVLIALAVLLLAVRTGSFSNAGAVLDNLVQRPVHTAADKAGSALEAAGQNIKNTAGSGQRQP
jgi:hypothetical protein